MFKPGDLVKYTGLDMFGIVNGQKYTVVDCKVSNSTLLVEIKIDKFSRFVSANNFELLNNKDKLINKKCDCNLRDLLTNGCKCGGV